MFYLYGERRKKVMMEFFKLIRKYSAEIGNQKEREQRENGAYIKPAAGSTARSTSVHKRAQGNPLDRPVDRGKGTACRPRQRNGRPWVDRLARDCSRFVPVDRRRPRYRVGRPVGRPTGESKRRFASPFRIQTSFLNRG